MHKFELDLKSSYSFNFAFFGKEYKKQELKSNDYLKLYGALSLFYLYNKDVLESYGYDISMEELIDHSAIQGDALYLNDFEGYWISDRLKLNSLHLNGNDCVILSVYDSKFGRYIDFVS